MTRLQFIVLITPSLGSVVLVILAWMYGNHRFTDQRVDTNRQFDAVNRRLDFIAEQLSTRASQDQVATLANDFRSFYGLEQKLEGRVDELSKRIA